MATFTCRSCRESFDSDTESSRCKPCFKTHLQGLKFGFTGGGSYGRSSFHDMTIGERQREILEGAAEIGVKAEPVGTRWV
jgi:transposase-like protein